LAQSSKSSVEGRNLAGGSRDVEDSISLCAVPGSILNRVAMDDAVQQNIPMETTVTQYATLVRRIAYSLKNRLPDCVQLDDLIQAGMIGLLEAADQYDAEQGAKFETYAGIRIRGAMLDELRRLDWTPRSVHKKARLVAEAIWVIENRTGRDARDAEVAEVLGMELAEYQRILQDSMGCRTFSLEELADSVDHFLVECGEVEAGPVEGLTRVGFKSALMDAIAGFPERERWVISLYYEDDRNLREIGEIIGISESRVCQINRQAMMRLRARMRDWLDTD